MVSAPLSGLRVLDLTRFVAGSQATATLAALGAEVIKIEVPPGGDPYRVQGTERVGGQSVLFMSLNSGKRSVALDMRAPEAADAIERLLQSADFLVENARPGSLARHGLDWESVHARHPSLVYGSISGYGDVGPDASRGGFDLILQAESGVMSITGSPGSGPVKVGAPVLDVGAGLSCVARPARRTRRAIGDRRGTPRDVVAARVRARRLGTLAASYFVSGDVPGLLGTHSPTFAPYGGFRTADGWIVLAGAGSEDLWVRCCRVLGLERAPLRSAVRGQRGPRTSSRRAHGALRGRARHPHERRVVGRPGEPRACRPRRCVTWPRSSTDPSPRRSAPCRRSRSRRRVRTGSSAHPSASMAMRCRTRDPPRRSAPTRARSSPA